MAGLLRVSFMRYLAGFNLEPIQPHREGTVVGTSLGPVQPVTKRLHREKTQRRDSFALGGLARNPCILSKKRRVAAYLEFGILAACDNANSAVALECLNTS